MFNATRKKKVIVKWIDAARSLLANEAFIFSSQYGKKGVTDSNLIRLKNQLTKVEDIKVRRHA